MTGLFCNTITVWPSVSKMAPASKLGGFVLSRIAPPTTCLRAATPRSFSTSIVLRANDSNPKSGNGPSHPIRSNPLVGNILRSQRRVDEPVKAEAAKTSGPFKTFRPPRDAKAPSPIQDMPPPPPPRAAETPADAKTETPSTGESHPYTAAASKEFEGFDIASIVSVKSAAFGESISSDPMTRPNVRAKAITGRTVFIKDRVSKTTAPTPTIALRVLNKMVRDEQVRNKYHSQKFHERKGLKKKRLRSQRWRARFKTGFKATVARVKELKKQGW
ncbi:Fc.00g079640.m01.CDS01 [Cosmosporella sp. VM-42]